MNDFSQPFAGHGRRFGAFLIDSLIMGLIGVIVCAPVFFLFMLTTSDTADYSPLDLLLLIVMVGLIMLVHWFYSAGFECSRWQATPGKMMLGIYVVDRDENRLSFGRASARFGIKWVLSQYNPLGYLVILFTPLRQGLHDLIAGTFVLQR